MNQVFGLRNDSVRDLEGRAYGERSVLRSEVDARASHPNEAKLMAEGQAESLIKPVVSPDAIIICTISDLATCIAESMLVTCPLRVMAAMLDAPVASLAAICDSREICACSSLSCLCNSSINCFNCLIAAATTLLLPDEEPPPPPALDAAGAAVDATVDAVEDAALPDVAPLVVLSAACEPGMAGIADDARPDATG
jgi:hypothetical protein